MIDSKGGGNQFETTMKINANSVNQHKWSKNPFLVFQQRKLHFPTPTVMSIFHLPLTRKYDAHSETKKIKTRQHIFQHSPSLHLPLWMDTKHHILE